MEITTAAQAAEAAKGLTFEIVWAALMESRQQMEKSNEEFKKQMQESDKRMQESNEEFKKQMQESDKRMRESYEETQKQMRES